MASHIKFWSWREIRETCLRRQTGGDEYCGRKQLEIEELAEALGLGATDGDLGLLLVVHAELVAGLEPGHDFADLVDVDDETAMGPPEARRIEEFEEFLKGAAF